MDIEFVDLSREQVDAIVEEIQGMVLDLAKGERGRKKIKKRILGMMADGTIFQSTGKDFSSGDCISFNYEVNITSDAIELIFLRLEAEKRHAK